MRIAVVTGASSGMGKEFAKQIPKLYKKLDEIWLVGRSSQKLETLKKELAIPVRVFDGTLNGDLSRDYIYGKLVRELQAHRADIRMLVNCAGLGIMGDLAGQSEEDALEMLDINCRALTRMTMLALPFLSKGSRIVQLASAAAFSPQPGFAVYAATKSYVYSFSAALRSELKDRDIVVTTVCPGPVDTDFFVRAGALKGTLRKLSFADPKAVVHQALLDSARRRKISVYGTAFRIARIAAKLLPEEAVLWLLEKGNK